MSLNTRLVMAALLLQLPVCAAAWAQTEFDRVHLLNGQSVPGRVETTKTKVIARVGEIQKEFPANEVKYIEFLREPQDMKAIRESASRQQWADVIAAVDGVGPAQRGAARTREELDFYGAMARARLAATGKEDAQAAGRALLAFTNAYKDSFHFYAVQEAAGDLLLAMGRNEQAPAIYAVLAEAPWPEAKIRADIGIGRALLAQGKHRQAMEKFDTAIAASSTLKGADPQIQAAQAGKAACLIEIGRPEEALAMSLKAISGAVTANNAAQAAAYNAAGAAYLKLNRPKDALFAYLHVDLLFNQSPEQHAEALYHLKELWTKANQPDRAAHAAEALKRDYGSSRWNKQK